MGWRGFFAVFKRGKRHKEQGARSKNRPGAGFGPGFVTQRSRRRHGEHGRMTVSKGFSPWSSVFSVLKTAFQQATSNQKTAQHPIRHGPTLLLNLWERRPSRSALRSSRFRGGCRSHSISAHLVLPFAPCSWNQKSPGGPMAPGALSQATTGQNGFCRSSITPLRNRQASPPVRQR